MKMNKETGLMMLASNLELMMQNKGKFLAISTDTDSLDLLQFANNLVSHLLLKNKKILIATYETVSEKIKGLDYHEIDINKDYKDEMNEKAKKYDYVIVICPNMLVNKSYLHMSNYVKDILVVAKKWKSKTNNILNIKAIIQSLNMNILGLVYCK